MKTYPVASASITALAVNLFAGEVLTLETAPPVVVKTVPCAGATYVDPTLNELSVTFSKPMQDGSWSWVKWDEETFPEMGDQIRYAADGKTCIMPVRLQPEKSYAIWLNYEQYKNFRDTEGRSAVPYLLTFRTGPAPSSGRGRSDPVAGLSGGGTVAVTGNGETPSADFLPSLNENQKAVVEWTDRQFRSFFDRRSFAGWTEQERRDLESKLIDALKGPRTREYYQAINTLGAMRSTKALSALRGIAYEQVDRDNRDRWMSIRAIGLIKQPEDVPELIRLVYHGNVNTRWWAQISLVRITGQNYGGDWAAWGNWWNGQNGQPPYKPEIIRWWSGQPDPDQLATSLAESDKSFLDKLRPEQPTSRQKSN